MSQNLSSAAVVIGALRVNSKICIFDHDRKADSFCICLCVFQPQYLGTHWFMETHVTSGIKNLPNGQRHW